MAVLQQNTRSHHEEVEYSIFFPMKISIDAQQIVNSQYCSNIPAVAVNIYIYMEWTMNIDHVG